MSDEKRKILVTTALPYANAELHLGHMLEHVQANIWVSFQKLLGNSCINICGDDAHGTAITLSAEKKGITPEELINAVHKSRIKDFTAFNIHFDCYHSTHSNENLELTSSIYQTLKKNGHMASKKIVQSYDPEKKIFLADRYIKGTCPKCGSEDQYGDNCEVCGATYQANELKNPKSLLSGAVPIEKESEHIFFKLSNFTEMLKRWTTSGAITTEISNKLNEWLTQGLHDWDISRDAPYFGFEIPEEKNKYFYVWMDAPIGYMAAFKHLCDKNETLNFDEYWNKKSELEVHHFIGKDIINFHCLFWPAMLEGAGFRKPNKIVVHGYLTINGEKMSKSRGTFINVKTYLKHLNPEYLRYYFATKLNRSFQDHDINMEDFTKRVNSDLIGKLINIASRCSKFINKYFDNTLSDINIAPELTAQLQQKAQIIASHYNNYEFGKAMRDIMALADSTNAWIDQQKPWVVAKDTSQQNHLQNICSIGINLFRLLMIYIKPVLPETVKRAEIFLNVPPFKWNDHKSLLNAHKINQFKPLMTRLDPMDIKNMLEENNAEMNENKAENNHTCNEWIINNPIGDEINFDDFSKLDLRVGKVIECSHVEGSHKLLAFKVDVGEGRNRSIFSGIKNSYDPESLVGKQVIVVANLQPRKMRFGLSEGMILCAGTEKPYLIEPIEGAEPGMPVN